MLTGEIPICKLSDGHFKTSNNVSDEFDKMYSCLVVVSEMLQVPISVDISVT